jgi:hypothetical protein
MSGSPVRRVLKKHSIRTPMLGSPARPIRYVFSATKYSQIFSRHGGNDVCGLCFWRGNVHTDQRRDEGVGACGGELGSSASARRSLAAASPARVLSLPWGRDLKLRRTDVGRGRRSGTVWQRRSFGSTAAGNTRYGGLLEKNYSRTQHLLWFGDSIPMSDTPLP